MAFLSLLVVLSWSPVSAGVVRRIGSLVQNRRQPSVTPLPDGRFLVAGGNGQDARLELLEVQGARAVSTIASAATPLPLILHTATLLPSGEVLLIGGGHDDHGRRMFGSYGDRGVLRYQLDTLTPLPELSQARMAHRTVLLSDGRALVIGGKVEDVGGFHFYQDSIAGVEIVTTGGTRVTAPMHEKRAHHTATLLDDGRVLVTGGEDFSNPDQRVSSTAEVYDPVTESWQYAGSMHAARAAHTATLLQDGRVLIAGGNAYAAEPTAEIFDPAANAFTPAADVGYRIDHTAQLLRDGTVLLFGGTHDAVVYDPASDSIVDSVELPQSLARYAGTLLPDGSVLLVGDADVYRYTRNSGSPRRRSARH